MTTTTAPFRFEIDAQLPNGAIIKGVRPHPNGDNVVLAYWEGHTAEWVTWRADGRGNCYWGHYFRDEKSALNDFTSR